MAQPRLSAEAPRMGRPSVSPLGLSLVIAIATGLLLALMGFQVASWQARAREASALVVARALADAASRVDISSDAGEALLQQAVVDLEKRVPEVRTGMLLVGTRFVAHTSAELAGTRLQRENLEHKALYDDSRALQESLSRNAEEHRKYPDLVKNPYEMSLVRGEGALIHVAVPVITDGDVSGMVVLKVQSGAFSPGGIALQLTLAGAGFIVLTMLLARFVPSLPQPMIGVAFMAAACVILWLGVNTGTSGLRAQVGRSAGQSFGVWKDLVQAAQAPAPESAAEAAPGAAEALPGAADGVTGAPEAAAAAPEGAPAPGSAPIPSGETGVAAPVELAPAQAPVPPRAIDPGLLLQALNQDTFGNPVDLFAAITLQPLSGPDVLSAEGVSVGFGPAMQVDARWTWGGLGAILAGVALYLALQIAGWTRRISESFLEHWYAYAYVSPAVIGTALLVFGPFIFGIGLGFFTRVYSAYEFVWFQNFVDILSDPHFTQTRNFYRTFAVTVLWTVVNVTLHVSIGLGLAMILKDKTLRFTPVYRTLLVVPWALPNYITALIWKGMFNKEYGVVNTALALVGIEPVSWFNSFWGAFTANLVTNVWLGFPFMMVISLGALQSIPAELYEAADVDGAGRWDKFWRITVPLLKPALFPAIILGTIWTFNQFNVIYLVSGGAPDGATDILITEAYRWAFEGRQQFGYAAAYSTIIFLILFGYTYVTNKITKSTEGAFE